MGIGPRAKGKRARSTGDWRRRRRRGQRSHREPAFEGRKARVADPTPAHPTVGGRKSLGPSARRLAGARPASSPNPFSPPRSRPPDSHRRRRHHTPLSANAAHIESIRALAWSSRRSSGSMAPAATRDPPRPSPGGSGGGPGSPRPRRAAERRPRGLDRTGVDRDADASDARGGGGQGPGSESAQAARREGAPARGGGARADREREPVGRPGAAGGGARPVASSRAFPFHGSLSVEAFRSVQEPTSGGSVSALRKRLRCGGEEGLARAFLRNAPSARAASRPLDRTRGALRFPLRFRVALVAACRGIEGRPTSPRAPPGPARARAGVGGAPGCAQGERATKGDVGAAEREKRRMTCVWKKRRRGGAREGVGHSLSGTLCSAGLGALDAPAWSTRSARRRKRVQRLLDGETEISERDPLGREAGRLGRRGRTGRPQTLRVAAAAARCASDGNVRAVSLRSCAQPHRCTVRLPPPTFPASSRRRASTLPSPAFCPSGGRLLPTPVLLSRLARARTADRPESPPQNAALSPAPPVERSRESPQIAARRKLPARRTCGGRPQGSASDPPRNGDGTALLRGNSGWIEGR